MNTETLQKSYKFLLKPYIESFYHPWNFTLTFSFDPSKRSAKKHLERFHQDLCRRVYGKAHKRFGKSIRMLVVIENSGIENIHFHGILETPIGRKRTDFFHSTMSKRGTNDSFRFKSDLWTHGKSQIIVPKKNGDTYLEYILKTTTKEKYSDSIITDYLGK